MTTRATLHELIDSLPEELLPEAEDSLGRLAADRAWREAFWNAHADVPLEDEELSPRELAAVKRVREGDTSPPLMLTRDQAERLLFGQAN